MMLDGDTEASITKSVCEFSVNVQNLSERTAMNNSCRYN